MWNSAEKSKLFRQRCKENKLCIHCGLKTDSNTNLCVGCREKKRLQERERIKNLKIAGICVGCYHAPAVEGTCKCNSCHEKMRASQRKIRDEVIAHYGGFCQCCGETTDEFLCIDHVNNDGAEHRKIIGSGPAIFRWLRKNNYPEGFQILCWNCNATKSLKGGCPHQKSVFSIR